jgi:Leucine-rich repeat (LRR) protein
MVKAQDWLEQHYPRDQRKNIFNLDISNKNLESDLIIEGFYNLKSFSCPYNKISSISIRDCKDIEIIDCGFNFLEEIELPDSSNNKIRVLMLHNNNLSKRNLSLFSSFINLEILRIGNELTRERNNDFFGSLKYLRYLKNLKRLDIQSTDIDSGLEYLPESVEEI